MAFCSNCGTRCDDAANFCAICGRALKPGLDVGMLPVSPTSAAENIELVEPRIRTGIPDFVRQVLHPSESVLGVFSASLFDHGSEEQLRHDKFVLTNERIIYYHTSLIHKGMGEMPYKAISGVSYNRGWFHGKVVIEGPNVSLTLDGIGNDDAAFADKVIASCVAGRKLAAAPPAPEKREE